MKLISSAELKKIAREGRTANLAINYTNIELNRHGVTLLGSPERVGFLIDDDAKKVIFLPDEKGRKVNYGRGGVVDYRHTALQRYCATNGGLGRRIKGKYDKTTNRLIFDLRSK